MKLRLTVDRKRYYYPITDITEKDWLKIEKGKYLSDDQRSVQIKVSETLSKAQEAIDRMNVFSKTVFENHFYNKIPEDPSILQAFDHKINILRENEQIGTMQAYVCAKSSIIDFFSNETKLTEISADNLASYEKSMLANGRSINTVSLYLRSLRHLYHLFDIPKKYFPFGSKKYQISKKAKMKTFLTKEEINKIFTYNFDEHSDLFAYYVSLWKLSFLAQGAQIADIARLKNENITDQEIYFYRRKTQRTRRADLKPIICPLHPEAKIIIDRYRNSDKSPNAYLFPILNEQANEEEHKQKIHTLRKCINKRMKTLGLALGINKKITTASSRDAFANILYQNGEPLGLIGEALGHTNPKTTMNYIAGFNHDKKLKTYDGIFE